VLSNEFLLKQLHDQYEVIRRVAMMTPAEQRDNNGKQTCPQDAVFVNVIFFNIAFRDAKERGILNAVELQMGQNVWDNTF
jgi:hypothetical protein